MRNLLSSANKFLPPNSAITENPSFDWTRINNPNHDTTDLDLEKDTNHGFVKQYRDAIAKNDMNRNALRSMIETGPEKVQVTKGRRLGAILAGGLGGYSGGAENGAKLAASVINEPQDRADKDYNAKVSRLSGLASLDNDSLNSELKGIDFENDSYWKGVDSKLNSKKVEHDISDRDADNKLNRDKLQHDIDTDETPTQRAKRELDNIDKTNRESPSERAARELADIAAKNKGALDVANAKNKSQTDAARAKVIEQANKSDEQWKARLLALDKELSNDDKLHKYIINDKITGRVRARSEDEIGMWGTSLDDEDKAKLAKVRAILGGDAPKKEEIKSKFPISYGTGTIDNQQQLDAVNEIRKNKNLSPIGGN